MDIRIRKRIYPSGATHSSYNHLDFWMKFIELLIKLAVLALAVFDIFKKLNQ